MSLVTNLRSLPPAILTPTVRNSFVDPLVAELVALQPIVKLLDSERGASTATFNDVMRDFQSTAARYEPAMDDFLRAQGLRPCVQGG